VVAPQTTPHTPPIPTPHPKAYDGSVVVTHVVQEGQTLSTIAKIYRFPRWEPIWVYNTKVEKVFGDDPNVIRKGVTMFIPRNKAGYDRLIKKLESLKRESEYNGDRLRYELESDKYKLEAQKVLINFAGDVATLVASVALKAATAAKAATVAERSAGQAKIAARLAARAQTRELATKFAEVRGRLLGTALKDQRAATVAKEGMHELLRGKSIDAAVKVSDATLGRLTGQDDVNYTKHAKNAWQAGKVVYKVAHGTMKIGHAVGETAEILVDYLEPSTLAETWLRLTTGETTEQSYERAQEHIRQSVESTCKMIEGKIKKYAAERALLYG
jgi:hypothetical protein